MPHLHGWSWASAALRLNLRVAGLIFRGRWLSAREQAASYDRIAPDYDHCWLTRLQPVTDRLLAHLPNPMPSGPAIDLGCGTGYAAACLLDAVPGPWTLTDLSPGMLEQARRRLAGRSVAFIVSDMLTFLKVQPPRRTALIVSTWSLGYSQPAAILRAAARALSPDGCFAFVVNLRNTMAPVFDTFRRCMTSHPNALQAVTRPRFPRSASELNHAAARAGLTVVWQEEGRQPVQPPNGSPWLPWLLRTGVLAGFDRLLPLDRPGPVADQFESLLQANHAPVFHHYSAMILRTNIQEKG